MNGREAQHQKLGKCIIRRIIETGPAPIAVVKFVHLGLSNQKIYLNELRDPQSGRRLEIEFPAAAPTKTAGAASAAAAEKPPWHNARSAIFALQLGQCPSHYIDRLTVGAERIREACDWALQRSDAGKLAFLIFESEYGKGKTHALNLLASAALAPGEGP